MLSIYGFISGQLGKCIEELEKGKALNENNLLEFVINQIAKIPINNKFEIQLDKLTHLIPKKYKKEDGIAILEKISSIRKNVFSEEEKLTWMERKASEGIEQTIDLIENLDHFDLKNTHRSSLLDLCLLIVKQGETAQVSLVKNLDKLGLDPLDCLDLCNKIVERNPAIEKVLYSELKKDSFIQEIAKLKLTERLEFCRNFSRTHWATYFLKNHFDSLKFVEEISALDESQRLPLCKKLAQNGLWASNGLISNFTQLGLDKVLKPLQRLPLWIAMAKSGKREARIAIDQIKYLSFEEIEPSTLLELWIAIAEQGLFVYLLRNRDSFGLEKLSLEERFKIGNTLRDTYKNSDETQAILSGYAIADRFDKLGFIQDFKTCESFKARVELCNRIAVELGNWGLAGLIKNFDTLGFEEATTVQRLDLCSKLARKGFFPAEYMAKYFPQLGFGKTSEDIDARFKLCCLINGLEGPTSLQTQIAVELAKNIDALGIEKVSYQNKIDFTMDLLNKGGWVAMHLTSKLGFFSPQKNEVLDCLNLCMTFAEKGNEFVAPSDNIAENFQALQLPYSSMTESEIQKLILLLNTLIRKKVSFENLPLKDKSIPDQIIVKIYLGVLLDTSLPQLSTVLEDPRVSDLKPCLELILFKFPLERDPDYEKKKEEFFSLQKNFQNLLESRSEFKLFKDEFEKIKSHDSIFIQSQLVKALAYATSLFSDLDPMKLDVVAKSHLFETILSHQNPTDRFLLIKELRIAASENMQELKDLSRHENLSPDEKVSALAPLNHIERDWGKLTWLLLSHLKNLGLSQEATAAIVLSIDQRGLSTTKNLTTLLSFFHNLIQRGPFSSEKKQGETWSEKELLENYLIKTVWDNKALEKIKFVPTKKDRNKEKVEQEDPMKNILGRAGMIKMDTKKPINRNSKSMAEVKLEIQGSDNVLTIFDRKQFFEFLRSNQDSSKVFMEHFQELFPVGNIEDLNEKFASTFGDINKFRDPQALYTYAKQLTQLPKEQKDRVNKTLTEYVSSVLTGTFKKERYSTKDNPHLEVIFKDAESKKAWLQAESPRHITKEQYSISESDDPCDLLLIGTEVPSCQSVTSDPYTSKCLPHYLMGGEIIPIVVKYPNGGLVARSVLRYLVDEKNNPVLLQEKIYNNKREDLEIQKEINEWAIRKAQRMNCPLVSMQEQSEKYDGAVKYLGGRTPYQYTDAGGGVRSGPFEINWLSLIYSPT